MSEVGEQSGKETFVEGARRASVQLGASLSAHLPPGFSSISTDYVNDEGRDSRNIDD